MDCWFDLYYPASTSLLRNQYNVSSESLPLCSERINVKSAKDVVSHIPTTQVV